MLNNFRSVVYLLVYNISINNTTLNTTLYNLGFF